MPDGQKWKVQWRGGRPVIPELEAEGIGLPSAIETAYEELYGVKFNYPSKGFIMMPDGEITTMDWWNSLSPEQKRAKTGGIDGARIDKAAGVVYAGNKVYDLTAWKKMTPEKQKQLTAPVTPATRTGISPEFSKYYASIMTGKPAEMTGELTPEERALISTSEFREARKDLQKTQQWQIQQNALTALQNARDDWMYGLMSGKGNAPTPDIAGLAGGDPELEATLRGAWGTAMQGIAGQVQGQSETQWGATHPTGKAAERLAASQANIPGYYTDPGFSPEGQAAAAQYGMQLDQRNAQLSELTGAFENARQQILRTTSPRDWVIRERARSAENPYAQFKPTSFVGGTASGPPGITGREGGGLQQTQWGSGGPSWGLPPNYAATMPLSKEIEKMLNPLASEEMYGLGVPSGIQKFLGNRNPYGTQKQVQGVIPGWNPPFAQGRPNPMQFQQYPAGTFGTPVETPSAQGWAAAPWTVREQLMGYLEAMGQQPADLLASMQRMQPNEPSRGTAWRPRLQYA